MYGIPVITDIIISTNVWGYVVASHKLHNCLQVAFMSLSMYHRLKTTCPLLKKSLASLLYTSLQKFSWKYPSRFEEVQLLFAGFFLTSHGTHDCLI